MGAWYHGSFPDRAQTTDPPEDAVVLEEGVSLPVGSITGRGQEEGGQART
jgi:hypothetical protein